MSLSPNAPSARLRRLGLGLLLLAVPACGLSDYEARMLDAQEREKHFLEEEKYLDKQLVEMPKKLMKLANEKKEREVDVDNVFFRPPKGIGPKPSPQQRHELMWTYASRQPGSDFMNVEMAFADNDKDFAVKVLKCYEQAGQHTPLTLRQIPRRDQEPPLAFDHCEFSSGQSGVSVNILKGRAKPIAIVYIYKKTSPDIVDKTIELSLQSLAFDQQVFIALQRFNKKSPWQVPGR